MIHLSTDEAAKARQIAQDFRGAQDRDNRATRAWQNFRQSYQAAHPELPGLIFASDFGVAFAFKKSSGPLGDEKAAVELSAEEGQKAESLHRETLEAMQALNQARKNWVDFQHELVADHVPTTGLGVVFTLPSGRSATIPSPWDRGVAFTPDFRVAVPRLY